MFYQVALGSLNPTSVTILVNVISFATASSLYLYDGGVEKWPYQGLLWFVGVGLTGSLFGRYMSFVSQRLVGVARTSIDAVDACLVHSFGRSLFGGTRKSRYFDWLYIDYVRWSLFGE